MASMRLKAETVIALIGPARARAISVQDLAHLLMDTIAQEGLTDAILDDAEEVERVAVLRGLRKAPA